MRYLLTTLLILFLSYGYAQVGDPFPSMEAESLTNEFVNIPKDLSDKHSVIGLAYSKKSENYLKTWFEPAYNQFIYKPEKPSVFSISYDIHCFFVPMFTGAKRPAYQGVMKKMKKTIDKRLLPNVLFYKGQLKEYKKSLNFEGKDVPYFFVLNPDGKIVYATSGRYTERKMQEIVNALDEALSLD
ncbi:MAG: hypothetical protein AAGA66_03875 [Bacteroidota bacterium]